MAEIFYMNELPTKFEKDVAKKLDIPFNEAKTLIEITFNSIKASLTKGEIVRISSFGTFELKKENEEFDVHFRYSTNLKDKIDQNYTNNYT